MKKIYYILCILLTCSSIHAQESEVKEFTIQLDSSISRIRYQPDFINCETIFDSKKKIQIHYSLYKKSIKKFYVTDSCSFEELGIYNYEIRPNKKVYGSISHSFIPCARHDDDEWEKQWNQKYHYKSEDIQKFCLDLFDKIKITRKTIFLVED